MLHSVWFAEKIEQWEASISGEEGTEKCDNLVTLSPTLHKLWGLGNVFFALILFICQTPHDFKNSFNIIDTVLGRKVAGLGIVDNSVGVLEQDREREHRKHICRFIYNIKFMESPSL